MHVRPLLNRLIVITDDIGTMAENIDSFGTLLSEEATMQQASIAVGTLFQIP